MSEVSESQIVARGDAARLALEQLAEEHGATPSRVDAQRLCEQLGNPEFDTHPIDVLATAAETLGLRAIRFESSFARAVADLEPGQVLTAALPADAANSGMQRWIVLRRVGVRKAHLSLYDADDDGVHTSERTGTFAEIASVLGLLSEQSVSWLGAVPAMPCSAARSEPAMKAPTPLLRLRQLLRPERRDIAAVVVFALINGVLLLATPIAVQALVNFVAFGGAVPPLVVVALLLLGGLGFAALLSAMQSWTVELIQRRLFVRMFADLAARLPRVSLTASDRAYAPELVNRFFDVVTIQKIGSALLLDGLGALLSVLVGLVVLAFYHPLLLAFDVILLSVIAILVLGPLRRGTRTAILESKAKYAAEAWLEEIARNPLLFKAGGGRRWIFDESDRLAREWVGYRRAHFRVVFGQVIGVLALQAVASTAVLAIGGLLVIAGSLTLGQLVAAELIVTLVVSSVAKLGKHIEGFYDLMASTDKIGQLLDLPLEESGGQHPAQLSHPATLEFDRVQRATPQGDILFEGLSFEVQAGTSLGVTGLSGSGKTTLLELIWGLRRPTGGSIRIDGQDLRDLSLDWLRREASLASRTEIVVGTIFENIALARPYLTEEQVRGALESLGLLDQVNRLPDGLQTELRPGGHPLSAGQVQSLMVARAIVGAPRLLLFDQPLDQLSPEDRSRVLDMIFAPSAPWTLIVATNAQGTLQRCDQVLELPVGRIIPGPLDTRPLSA